jgi:hypothetical protein
MKEEWHGGSPQGRYIEASGEARGVWREVRMSDERAWFLSVFREESEERIEPICLAGANRA